MKEELTKKQEEILYIIQKFINENGYSPSVRDICKLSNRKSPGTIKQFLDILYSKGYITYNPKASRTIRVVKEI